MKIPPLETEDRTRSELLRDFFINALSLAFLNEAVTVPEPVPVRVRVEDEGQWNRLPEYYRG